MTPAFVDVVSISRSFSKDNQLNTVPDLLFIVPEAIGSLGLLDLSLVFMYFWAGHES